MKAGRCDLGPLVYSLLSLRDQGMLELGKALLCRLPFDGDRGDPPAQFGVRSGERVIARADLADGPAHDDADLPAGEPEVTVYVLVNVMTTVSAQILLYGPTPSRHRSRSCTWTRPARRISTRRPSTHIKRGRTGYSGLL